MYTGSHVTELPATSVTLNTTVAPWLWFTFVAVTTTGLVVPIVKEGTFNVALTKVAAVTDCKPLCKSRTVTCTCFGGPAITAVMVQLGGVLSRLVTVTVNVQLAELTLFVAVQVTVVVPTGNVCGDVMTVLPILHSTVGVGVPVAVTVNDTSAFDVLMFAGHVIVGAVALELPDGVSEKSSTAKPSSEPLALKSIQRIKKDDPLAMLSPVIVKVMLVRLAALFPSSNPTVGPMTGAAKSRPS